MKKRKPTNQESTITKLSERDAAIFMKMLKSRGPNKALKAAAKRYNEHRIV
jgi:hypothetical protein